MLILLVLVVLVKIVPRNELNISFGGNKLEGISDGVGKLRNGRNIES
jgi:hypothetical protein